MSFPLSGLFPLGSRRLAPLPYDAEVDWVEASGGPYVNTGIDSVGVSRIAHSWSFADRPSRFTVFFGHSPAAQGAGSRTRVAGVLYAMSDTSFGYVDYGRPSGTYRYSFSSLAVEDDRPIDISDNRTYTSRILLFRAAQGKATVSPDTAPTVQVRLHYFRIWDKSGVLVRSFVPVRVGTVGYLYDRANPTGGPLGNGLYGSETSTPLVAGPDKNGGTP